MEYSKIKLLLQKYYEGNTSVDEEKHLKEYFSLENIPAELRKEKELFISFSKIDNETKAGTELKNDLLELVENKWQESTKHRFKQIAKWSAGIAASLLVTFFLFVNTEKQQPIAKDTFSDKEEAYQVTKDALILVSEKMKMASEKLSGLQQINNGLNKLKRLDKINETIDKYKTEQQKKEPS